MNPLDLPLSSIPIEQIAENIRLIKEFLLTTPDPNTTAQDGRTCLTAALCFCDGSAEAIATSLLDRGADPNRPNALVNFQAFMLTAQHTGLLQQMIQAGLKLNEVYTVPAGFGMTEGGGRMTLLSYAREIDVWLGKRSKRFEQLVEKHAGPLTGRRRFVADVIEMLQAHGAIV